jgi:hypothetical protein
VLVEVVGVAGDPEAVRTALESVFPYALCLAQVQFSGMELEVVRDTLARVEPSWDVAVVPSLDRVLVRMPFVDSRADLVLTEYPSAVVVPLLTKQ